MSEDAYKSIATSAPMAAMPALAERVPAPPLKTADGELGDNVLSLDVALLDLVVLGDVELVAAHVV